MEWWWVVLWIQFGCLHWYLLEMSQMIWLDHGRETGLKLKREKKREGRISSLGRFYLEVLLDNAESREVKKKKNYANFLFLKLILP